MPSEFPIGRESERVSAEGEGGGVAAGTKDETTRVEVVFVSNESVDKRCTKFSFPFDLEFHAMSARCCSGEATAAAAAARRHAALPATATVLRVKRRRGAAAPEEFGE